jgi:hypothetical protein
MDGAPGLLRLAEEKQRQKQIPFGDDNKKSRQKKNKKQSKGKCKG